MAPLDQKLRDLNYFNIGSRLPAVLGGDLVGTVIKNGPKASLPIGTHVFSQELYNLPHSGGLQEYTIINDLYTAIVPNGVSDEEAALYPINAVTSAISLFSSAGMGLPFPGTPEAMSFDYKSQKLAIVGGGTNLGQLAIQFAKLAGIGTIIAIASPSGAEKLKSFGATHVIARQDPDIKKQVRHIVGDELLYVYDTYNAGDLSLGVSLLSDSKRGIFAHALTGQASEVVIAEKKEGFEDKRIQGFSHFIPEFGQLFWKQLPVWLETGKIKPLKFKTIEGLDAIKVNQALDGYGDGEGVRHHVRIG